MNSLSEIIFNLAYAFLSIGASALFWIKDKNSGLKRVLVSMHSCLLLLTLCMAFAFGGYDGNQDFAPIFTFLLVSAVVSVFASFIYFTGPKWFHLLHVWNIFAFVWTSFIGGMAVSGDWI